MDIAARLATDAATDRPAPVAAEAEPARPVRSSPLADLREIVHDYRTHGELLYELTLRDVRLRYKQAVMGFGWALFMPVLVVLSGVMVRYAMAYYSGSELQGADIAGMAVKALGWAFFVGAIGFATTSLLTNMNLVSKVYFPREVLPVSATLAQAVDSAVGGASLIVLLLALGVRPTAAWLWAPVLVTLLFLFTVATGLVLSSANLFFRDVKYIVQVVLTFGIFFTPVLFDATMFGARGARLLMLNPVAPLLEGLRLCLVGGHNLLAPLVQLSARGVPIVVWTPWYLAYAVLWSVGGLALASLIFHRLEFIFAEYV